MIPIVLCAFVMSILLCVKCCVMWVFLSRTFTNHWTRREGDKISLTPLYHFYLLHTHLYISWKTTGERSPLHRASDQTRSRNFLVSKRKPLTLKLFFMDSKKQEYSSFTRSHPCLSTIGNTTKKSLQVKLFST